MYILVDYLFHFLGFLEASRKLKKLEQSKSFYRKMDLYMDLHVEPTNMYKYKGSP